MTFASPQGAVEQAKKTVFITGITGSMGSAGLKILLGRKDRFNIVTLVRPSQINKKIMGQCPADVPGIDGGVEARPLVSVLRAGEKRLGL